MHLIGRPEGVAQLCFLWQHCQNPPWARTLGMKMIVAGKLSGPYVYLGGRQRTLGWRGVYGLFVQASSTQC